MQRGPGPARPPGGGRAVWRALGYLRRYRAQTIVALLALLCVSAANLAAPQMIRLAIDHGLAPGKWQTVLFAVVGLVVIAVGRGLFNFLQGYLDRKSVV